MRLFEILDQSPTYWMASNAKLAQTASRPDLRIRLDPRYSLAEGVLEHFRPKEALPRRGSILLARSTEDLLALGQKARLIYRAVPIGTLQWGDHAWVQRIREIMALPLGDRPSCEEYATSYWVGREFRVGAAIWEGRVQGVEIIGRPSLMPSA